MFIEKWLNLQFLKPSNWAYRNVSVALWQKLQKYSFQINVLCGLCKVLYGIVLECVAAHSFPYNEFLLMS